MSAHPHVSLVMATGTYDLLFGSAELARLRSLAHVNDPVHATSVPALGADLARTEVLITSWGCPPLQESDLDAAPQLQAVLHAAGSARGILPESVYERGIHVVTAADANAVPVAEYTLAAIILAAKRALPRAVANRTAPAGWSETFATPSRTSPARTIGIVGFSRIGRRVVDLLAHVTTGEVLVADPVADPREVAQAGAHLVSLPELLERADTLSLHAPLLPQTRGMIGAAELAQLPEGATVINTARGGLLDHAALARECASGRLDAILDVTEPEPLPRDHELLGLPNVTVTPHLAGALGAETRRLTDFVLTALEAYTRQEPMHGLLRAEHVGVSA